MSDYSNLKIEKVDDLPTQFMMASRLSKPLAPVRIFETLPILEEMGVGDTIKVAIPEDCFTYSINTAVPRESGNYYASLKSALFRTFDTLSKQANQHFVYRVVGDDLYIKRVES